MNMEALALAKLAREILADKKGEDPRLLDVRKLSGITDYYLIVSGGSPAHLKALFNEVLKRLKDRGVRSFRKSGDPESGWMVIDYVDVIIHILMPESRSYYAIESLWERAPQVG
jgi:ribosome-associated protein